MFPVKALAQPQDLKDTVEIERTQTLLQFVTEELFKVQQQALNGG